jgi:ATP-binding cassette subfamily B (MDR/TAP) protein 1
MMFVGSLAALANGAAFPLFSVIFGEISNSFTPTGEADYGDKLVETAGKLALWFFLIGCGSFVCSYIMFSFWMISGERQAIRFR